MIMTFNRVHPREGIQKECKHIWNLKGGTVKSSKARQQDGWITRRELSSVSDNNVGTDAPSAALLPVQMLFATGHSWCFSTGDLYRRDWAKEKAVRSAVEENFSAKKNKKHSFLRDTEESWTQRQLRFLRMQLPPMASSVDDVCTCVALIVADESFSTHVRKTYIEFWKDAFISVDTSAHRHVQRHADSAQTHTYVYVCYWRSTRCLLKCQDATQAGQATISVEKPRALPSALCMWIFNGTSAVLI